MNARLLRAEIVKAGLSQASTAREIGMLAPTFYRKMKRGSFGVDEAEKIIRVLGITDNKLKNDIFFDSQVSQQDTNKTA